MAEEQYVNMLIDVLNKQIAALNEMLDATKEQERLALEEDFDADAFDDTLSRKDLLLIRLNELDDGFSSMYNRARKEIKSNTSKYKKEIELMQGLIRQCTDLGNEIRTLENMNSDRLSDCFTGKKKEYTAKQAAATVANKYSVTMKNVNVMNEGYRFNQDK